MVKIKMHSGPSKHIESILYRYPEILKEIKKRREELLSKPSEELVGGKSNLPSNPTSNIAMMLADDKLLQELERFANVVEYVYNIASDDHKKLIRLKYWTKPQTKTWDGIALEMGKGRTSLFRWRDEVIQAIGERLGWR